jgi:hypothetical protein
VIRISVLCPTRGRPEALARSIASLMDNADKPAQVEVILAVDPDDETSYLHVLNGATVIAWPAPQRFGYQNLHMYYNGLVTQAYGKWLFIWNDDAIMKTKGWDTVVVNHAPALLFPTPDEAPHCNAFPIFPTEWARVMGRVGGGAYVDTWLQTIGEQLSIQERVPIEVSHHAPDDQTFREGRAITPLFGHEHDVAIAHDAENLRQYLEGRR